MARRKKADETTARVRNLLALDAAGIMRRLAARREDMFLLFSRLRSRGPLVETVASRYADGAFAQLIHLTEQEQAVVDHFYGRLDELRWYFTYTEDMPGTAHQTFNSLHRRLEESYRLFVDTLGLPVQPDGVRVVNAEAVRQEATAPEATPVALAPLPRRRRAPPA
ncbi:hypothetical protein HJC10_19955 [Corallococcus exiguus]|uniref:hypothetical protein n=1 Tax=Corallococcus TaxID=83461 RepID=UPI000EC0BCCD|nr:MULTISPECIES: hypothetical protein [Corallococcus]NNB86686.1 hypothetical protein [Corallococcus exiguus]NNB96284.1 hypothetical protein [Corallococcus exiguus]NNC05116.1 hypothetical protein [Corallococcus exiguus]NPC48967.1 hypothetical protein [Corallococcus exiguus]RKH86606.1 hypothetical protein D7X99_02900 [Corallococcus sp. AB032C]